MCLHLVPIYDDERTSSEILYQLFTIVSTVFMRMAYCCSFLLSF